MRSAAALATFSAAALVVIAALSFRSDTPWMDASSSMLASTTNSKELESPNQRDLARLRHDALSLEKMSSARSIRSGEDTGTLISLPRVRPEARSVSVLPGERDAKMIIVGQRRFRGRRNRGMPMPAGAIRGTRRVGRLGIGLGGGGVEAERERRLRAVKKVALAERHRLDKERGVQDKLRTRLQKLREMAESGERTGPSGSLASTRSGGAVGWVRGKRMLVKATTGTFAAGPSRIIVKTRGGGRGRFVYSSAEQTPLGVIFTSPKTEGFPRDSVAAYAAKGDAEYPITKGCNADDDDDDDDEEEEEEEEEGRPTGKQGSGDEREEGVVGAVGRGGRMWADGGVGQEVKTITVLAPNDAEFPPEGSMLVRRSGGGVLSIAYQRYEYVPEESAFSSSGQLKFLLRPGEYCPSDAAFASPPPPSDTAMPLSSIAERASVVDGGRLLKVSSSAGFKPSGGWAEADFGAGAHTWVRYAAAKGRTGGGAVLEHAKGQRFPAGVEHAYPEPTRVPYPVVSRGDGGKTLTVAAPSGGGFAQGGGEAWVGGGRDGELVFRYGAAEAEKQGAGVGERVVLHAEVGDVFPKWAEYAGPVKGSG
jgi:hypothetical protein